MSLLREQRVDFVQGNRLGRFGDAYVEDTTSTCHLIVRCDAVIDGPVEINGSLTVDDTINTCHLVVNCDAVINGPLDVFGDIAFHEPGSCLTFPDGTQQCTAQVAGPTGPQGPTGPSGAFTSYTVTLRTSNFAIPSLTTDPTYFNVYQVDTTSGPITVTLPAISTLDNGGSRLHYIVDVGGKLEEHPLLIQTSGGDTVGGESSMSVEVNYSSAQLMSNKSSTWLVV